MKRWLVVLSLLGAGMGLSGCGYNTIQTQDEQIKAAWSEVINQYQRRADLIPNLVNTVKGYAQQEQDVLLGVTNARGNLPATRNMRPRATVRKAPRRRRPANATMNGRRRAWAATASDGRAEGLPTHAPCRPGFAKDRPDDT